MRKIIRILFLAVIPVFCLGTATAASSVSVTLIPDENLAIKTNIAAAAKNLGTVLTEINRAQALGGGLSSSAMRCMDDFSRNALVMLWGVTPFYCDEVEVVEHVWVFADGTMTVQHIPLIITPTNKDYNYGMGTYQEAVVEFDANGQITDFRLAIDAQMSESLENCSSAASVEQRQIVLKYVERFRTAYNQMDIGFIEKMFSDDALIITGKVILTKPTDISPASAKVSYTKQTKE